MFLGIPPRSQRRSDDGHAQQKKSEMEDGGDNELLSEQDRILSPIFPPQIIIEVTDELYVFAASQFEGLFDSFGVLTNAPMAGNLKREDSHISPDNKQFRKNEGRLTHISSLKELPDMVPGEQAIAQVSAQAVLCESRWLLLHKMKFMRRIWNPTCS